MSEATVLDQLTAAYVELVRECIRLRERIAELEAELRSAQTERNEP